MTQPKKKGRESRPKIEISRRETKGKKKPDLFAKFRNTEHPLDQVLLEPLQPNEKNFSEPYPSTVPVSPPSEIAAPDASPKKSNQTGVSPTKNYTKVSNSLFEQALSERLFRGQSKHTYDVLYQKTRGAIVPKRRIQITKAELVKITGLEAKTIQRHISFLKSVGLIRVEEKTGNHEGAVYEIIVPEELGLPYPTLVYPTLVYPGIKYTWEGGTKYTRVHLGNHLENKELTGFLRLSLKQKKTDEAFAALRAHLVQLDTNPRARADWNRLVELIKMEFEIASARTKGVSNVPAFLTEHLRRRLIGKIGSRTRVGNKKRSEGLKKEFGEEPMITDLVESLSKESRESTLKTFVNYIEKGQKSFLMSLQDTYTIEDWNWLLKQIKKIEETKEIKESDNEK